MKEQIVALKHYVLELEYALSANQSEGVRNASRVMRDLLDQLESDMLSVQEKQTGVYFKAINTIPFLYKPIAVLNPYEGDYLERFSRERHEQLTAAGAIAQHNNFWTDHNVMRGNIFGSVPKELLSEDAIYSLKRMGWEEVKVDILDFGRRITDIKAISEFLEENFDHYIMIKEEPTQSTLALKFAV